MTHLLVPLAFLTVSNHRILFLVSLISARVDQGVFREVLATKFRLDIGIKK